MDKYWHRIEFIDGVIKIVDVGYQMTWYGNVVEFRGKRGNCIFVNYGEVKVIEKFLEETEAPE